MPLLEYWIIFRDALEQNTQSVKNMLEFAKQCHNLQSFVHVSTAYSNCDLQDIEEKIYPSKYDPSDLLNAYR